jgi:hypothetical protein
MKDHNKFNIGKLPEAHPQLISEKSKSLPAENIVANLPKKVWWQASKEANHEWVRILLGRTNSGNKTRCPVCVKI